MAYKNKTITNPITGQAIRFLQTTKDTNGALLEMETIYNAGSKEPPSHYHPLQSEDFAVLYGEVDVKINHKKIKLQAGETLHIPANTAHAMWNSSDGKAIVSWKVKPALETEYLLETITGLAIDGKTNASGRPGLLQTCLLMNKFSPVFRLSQPPYQVQRIMFDVLRPFALLRGLKAVYRKYID